eukprot:scaffold2876_cov46-Phaeocystis_antarctica.AAC.2
MPVEAPARSARLLFGGARFPRVPSVSPRSGEGHCHQRSAAAAPWGPPPADLRKTRPETNCPFWPRLAGEIARLRAKYFGALGVAQLEKRGVLGAQPRRKGQFMHTNADPCDGRCPISKTSLLRTSKHAVEG